LAAVGVGALTTCTVQPLAGSHVPGTGLGHVTVNTETGAIGTCQTVVNLTSFSGIVGNDGVVGGGCCSGLNAGNGATAVLIKVTGVVGTAYHPAYVHHVRLAHYPKRVIGLILAVFHVHQAHVFKTGVVKISCFDATFLTSGHGSFT